MTLNYYVCLYLKISEKSTEFVCGNPKTVKC